jgi:tetratricopeptide (TPR) repeat protein
MRKMLLEGLGHPIKSIALKKAKIVSKTPIATSARPRTFLMSIDNSRKLKNIMGSAIGLRNKQRTAEAIASLLPYVGILKRAAPGAGLLATLYWEQRDLKNAAKWFSQATNLAPQSEKASLGLFHSLWDLGNHDDAFDEMRRFLIVGKSSEYRRLLRELIKELHTLQVPISQLSIDEQYGFLAAELAGLDWRASQEELAPLNSPELQYA